ncbi:CCAAT/enhancer-binding protein zeta [Anopheles ziemanni]|uniref:CCAAT/enhancer-binding protein zeta n=1 Tax=Anopheles ziemanni TaxID=345580 RepID=UPI00265E44B8|nr:CCAAT/enhancer-binding protein zeta [Anopheles ziemanni]
MAIANEKVKKKSDQKSEKKEAKSSKNTTTEKDTVEKKPTKIVFTDDGEQRVVPVDYSEKSADTKSGKGKNKKGGNSSILSRLTQDDGDIPKRWYQLYEMFNTQGELIELKDAEITELKGLCRAAFDAECHARLKDNPSDAKWLQSAMEKGTTRDRASSGALLVQTNPFCNLPALETVIGMVKTSNKGHLDVLDVLTELMIKSMMPSHRKLIPIQQRGADWKNLKKQEISKDLRDKVYAHWHFEEQLYELYFSFLTNISMVLHSAQEASKCKAVVHSAKLFEQIPEKEAFLLTMLVNKMGDPMKTVAVKALYHLTNVVRTHPAMALVVTTETEKLLFRNNVSAKAQHYGLSFLSTISVYGDFATCQKMINVCFSFFKILTEKGEVNSRMMQSILNCLRRAIGNIKRDVNLSDIVKPELLNVMFRLIHLSDISIACQGLSLLLEVTEAEGIAQNRFYNALYRKLIDPHLFMVGPRIANVLFHILHRAIQNDPRPERAQAFVKRLLQVAFYFPPALVCAALIIINKILRKRRQLLLDGLPAEEPIGREEPEADAQSDDGGQDGEKEAKPAVVRNVKRYDGFHRASEFAGAQYTLKYELTRYLYYFHPTVQKFAASIISNTALTYYGDPLRDFALSHFLERFAFKNPKKPKPVTLDENGQSKRVMVKKRSDYVAVGSRALPVDMLTKDQCTEDDQYIFHFLEQKRERMQQAQQRKKKKGKGIDDDDDDEELDSDVESIDDDEFDAYLDRLGVPGGQDDGANLDREELDFMQELEKDLASSKKKGGKKGAEDDDDDDEDEDGLDDWDEVEGDEEDDNVGDSDDEFGAGGDDEFSDGGSISLDEDGEQMDDDEDDEDDDEEEAPVAKKRKKSASSVAHVSDRAFAKKLKTADMNSLFAAADDFSEMLEGNADESLSAKGAEGKRKKRSKNAIAGAHGTEMEVFNQDKSSVKQMAWEQTRFSGSNSKHYSGAGKKNFKAKNFAGAKKPFKGASKGKAKNRK